MATRTVHSIDELVEALGGTSAAAKALGAIPQKIVNWRNDGRMPARLFIWHASVLKELGIAAPPSLWGMEPAPVHYGRDPGDETRGAAA